MFGDNGFETSTTWNYKVIGRYTMPWEIGFSGSWKVQSGFQYSRTTSVAFPVEGNRNVRVEPVTANRYPSVQILDLRLDKSFRFGSFGRLTGMVDVFNLTNSGVVTTFADDVSGERSVRRGAGNSEPARRAVRRSVRLLSVARARGAGRPSGRQS